MTATASSGSSTNSGNTNVFHLLRAPVGGLFRHVIDLAHGQCARGLNVGIVCDSSTGAEFADSSLASLAAVCTLGVHRIPMQRTPGFSDFAVTRQIGRIIATGSPAILHGHGAKGAVFARILAKRVGAKAIYTPHGGSLHYSYKTISGAAYLTIERLLKRRTSGIIFESDYARRSYIKNVGAFTCQNRVIHNGLHENEFSRLSPDEATHDFVFIGELRNIKGIHVLLDAIIRLAERRTLSVLIVGQGDQEAAIRSRISGSHLEEIVTLSPSIHPATQAISKARCMVAPSLAESLPYIVLECLAAGVPLLTTRVGGIPEIFGPLSGQLLPAGDAPALADAMRGVLDDIEGARNNAELLRDRVRDSFRAPQMVSATIDFYSDVAAI